MKNDYVKQCPDKNKFYCLILLLAISLPGVFIGCENPAETVEVRQIPMHYSVQEKIVFVDSFLNLTENENLNLYEEGVAEMLEQALFGVQNIRIVERTNVKRFLAIQNMDTVIDVARELGAEYIINGWISRWKNGNYRIYANLFDVRSEELQEKIAVAEFENRELALPQINEFVVDITRKVSDTTGESASYSRPVSLDDEVYHLRMLAYSNSKNGQHDVAVSLLERALGILNARDSEAMDERDRQALNIETGKIHFSLSQLYTECGRSEKALSHLEAIWNHREKFGEHSSRLIEALWQEHKGDYIGAQAIYGDLIEQNPYEDYYYIRMADVALKQGQGNETALNILVEGKARAHNTTELSRQIAEIKFEAEEVEGEEDEELFVGIGEENEQNRGISDTNEVVSTFVNHRIERDIAKRLPYIKGVGKKGKLESTDEPRFLVKIGGKLYDASEMEASMDFSCPDEIESAVNLAAIAVRNGNVEIAYDIADVIDKKGTDDCAKDGYHSILSLALTKDGKIREAKKHTSMISANNPTRYIMMGNILLHSGEPLKAALTMEKALELDDEPHPLVYYSIANAYISASEYKKWSHYNRKFLESSAAKGYLPDKVRERLAKMDKRYSTMASVKVERVPENDPE